MARKNGLVIAVDGPAGVGKSTVCRIVAERLGYGFINTGEMYRALAWKALSLGMDPEDEAAVSALPGRLQWEFRRIDGSTIKTFLDGELMDSRILTETVSRTSSGIARYPGVREFMKKLQRELGREGAILMEGRDIGTAVFPDAELKIYLDAAPQARARRRCEQLVRAGISASYADILAGIIARDSNDKGRKFAPLKQAEDGVVVDTTDRNIGQVVDEILTLVKQR
ncbi:MAG: (d)CMP kinase [Elusimicrobiaceae bacterium]|nr:(d)CMP kinase [Elusimicrobiaceae bacterium]